MCQDIVPQSHAMCQDIVPQSHAMCQDIVPESRAMCQDIVPESRAMCQDIVPQSRAMCQDIVPESRAMCQDIVPQSRAMCPYSFTGLCLQTASHKALSGYFSVVQPKIDRVYIQIERGRLQVKVDSMRIRQVPFLPASIPMYDLLRLFQVGAPSLQNA
jgi:hypothetical protein